jgi:hypothetical protein
MTAWIGTPESRRSAARSLSWTGPPEETKVGATAAIAVMRLKEREVRDSFHAAGAVNPAAAMSLETIGIEDADEDVWLAVRGMRRRIAFLLIGTVILILLLVVYGTVSLQ